jgi:hypothetical protein
MWGKQICSRERENRTCRGNENGTGERVLKWGKGDLEQGEKQSMQRK